VHGWNARLKVFLGKCKHKIIGDGDMIADARCWKGCGEKLWNPHISVTHHRGTTVQPITVKLDIREVWMLKYCIRISRKF